MEQTSISNIYSVKPKTSWLAIASFIMAFIGLSFQIILSIISDHTNGFRHLDQDIATLLIILSIFIVIMNNIGIVFGFIGINKTISHKWIAIAGTIGNAFALHLFFGILSIASI